MSQSKLFHSILFLILISSFPSFSQQKTFQYTGSVQTYIVPTGVSQITVDMYGASGGWNDYSGTKYDKYIPGKGGRLQATFPVKAGQKLFIYVGGKGEDANSGSGGNGGFNGGGNGNTSSIYSGGGGGGASDIRIDGDGLNNRVLVVGGGGGAAYNYPDGGDDGGHGGDLVGGDGKSNFLFVDESRGRGATQTEGGIGGQWSSYDKAENGSLGKGGNGPAGTCGTGGGGGYYGGGGGCWSGGGGGSSYTYDRASKIKHEQGVNVGNGKIIINPNDTDFADNSPCTPIIVSLSGPTSFCQGKSITFTAKSNFGAHLTWDSSIQNNVAFVPPAGKNSYTVTSSNPKECSYTVELNVGSGTLKATTTNGIICEGETTTVIGFGGDNYSWTGGVQNNVAFIPPVGVNNYTVRNSEPDASGCGGEASVFVVVNKVKVISEIQQVTPTNNASINITPTGGTYPYTFIWTKDGVDYYKSEDLSNLAPGNYNVIVVDAIGCSATQNFNITGTKVYSPESTSLQAEMSSDQIYLNISFGGYFDYKIVNHLGEIVMTGAVNNSGRIDVSKLPAGNYRICALNETTVSGINFVKN